MKNFPSVSAFFGVFCGQTLLIGQSFDFTFCNALRNKRYKSVNWVTIIGKRQHVAGLLLILLPIKSLTVNDVTDVASFSDLSIYGCLHMRDVQTELQLILAKGGVTF